jgi:hypothetical protein
MSFKGSESCIHYLDKEMFETTVKLIDNQASRELVLETESYNSNSAQIRVQNYFHILKFVKENESQLNMADRSTRISMKFYEDLSCTSKRLTLKSQQLVYSTLKLCMNNSQLDSLTELMISWTNMSKSTLGTWIEDLCVFEVMGIKKNETRKDVLIKCKDEIQSGTCSRRDLFKLLEYHRTG